VRRALTKLGFDVLMCELGKIVEIESTKPTRPISRNALSKMADEMLANPVTEDYEVKI